MKDEELAPAFRVIICFFTNYVSKFKKNIEKKS